MGSYLDDYLAHYASQYYDPEKARQYYLRTRELKNRRSGKGQTKEERASSARTNEALGVARKSISEKRQGAMFKLNLEQQARMEKLRGNVDAARRRIVAKMEARMEQIMQETSIPANASPKRREFLMKQRAMRSGSAKQAASKELKKMATDMRNAVDKAREDYAKARKTTSKEFDKVLKTEEKNIRENIK